MKNLLWIIVLISFLVFTVSGAGISVMQPKGTTKWFMGGKKDIVWSNSPGVSGNIKIRLFNESGQNVLNIADNKPNTGSFKWTIPMTLAAGKYSVRVKTMDNTYFGNSQLFQLDKLHVATTIMIPKENVKLPNNVPQNIPLLKLPDFHVYDISLSKDNSLLIMYENFGSSYNGPLEMKYKIKGIETVVSRNVSIGKNMRSFFLTGRFLTAADLSDNGKSVGVWGTVDPNEVIAELKDTNNAMYRAVYPDLGIPDYKPTNFSYTVERRSDQPRHLPWGNFTVIVKNLGNSYNGYVNIQILYRFMDETGFPHSYPAENFQLNLDENQQKSIKLQRFYWPLRDTTTKERVVFQIKIIPAPGNPEIIQTNNVISRAYHSDGPF